MWLSNVREGKSAMCALCVCVREGKTENERECVCVREREIGRYVIFM